jgi:cell division protein FtsB
MDDLKKENEKLKKQIKKLEQQLYALYKERDKNDDDELVTDYQSASDEQLS